MRVFLKVYHGTEENPIGQGGILAIFIKLIRYINFTYNRSYGMVNTETWNIPFGIGHTAKKIGISLRESLYGHAAKK